MLPPSAFIELSDERPSAIRCDGQVPVHRGLIDQGLRRPDLSSPDQPRDVWHFKALFPNRPLMHEGTGARHRECPAEVNGDADEDIVDDRAILT